MASKLPHLLCNQTSGNFEIYTPVPIIEAARAVMGSIDLDPASSAEANKNVKAARYFTQQDDGLKQIWTGNVWMNHPYGDKEKACVKGCKKKRCQKRRYHLKEDFPGNAAWINKLITHHLNGDVDQAICITWASTSEDWFKPLKDNYPVCLPDGRTKFLLPDGTVYENPPKGTAITYLGPNIQKFADVFHRFGSVLYRVQPLIAREVAA